MAQIGIKLADGSFYPVLEDDSPHRKRMTLTVARDGQTSAQIDLLRLDGEQQQYVGCLVLEDLPADGATELELIVGLDDEGNVEAQVADTDHQQYQSLSVNLESIDLGMNYSMPEGDDDPGAIGGVDSLEDIALPDGIDTEIEDHDLGDLDLETAYADAPDEELGGGALDLDADYGDEEEDEAEPSRPPRPFSPLVLAAVLLIGLSLVALGAFAVFQWLQTEPLPRPQAEALLVPALLTRRRMI